MKMLMDIWKCQWGYENVNGYMKMLNGDMKMLMEIW